MATPDSAPEASFARLLRDAWTAYLHRVAAYQSAVLLNVVYAAVLGPSAVATRVVRLKLLDLDTQPRASYWRTRRPEPLSLEDLRRQF